ncbi:putative YTH domain-containing protein [Helianthus annuus]|uniref:YTH domain-containing family protein n=1 Tax=Helianthus annuus TaxID=4232 RepID=A0A251UC47_HELAN|nr:YTH domain-containing protein ECT4 isoform X1 [Helianthus annuus]KAF5797385.1 putative YTH domain-containing protein [Helianthus annuus]KAJ0549146.1 putative YTH domain-containing protein [Helianthus annuus]KAJ0562089.1 putative YTH domain-containing protein [Helianthus annuus]KAJ0906730.1 putative YTH domain-containing protein [Helianthus annuus]
MAAVAPPADQAADLLKNLSLDQSKTLEGSEAANKPSVDSEVNGNGQSQPVDRSLTPVIPDFMDPAVAYFPSAYPSPGYYYGGYDGATNDYSRLMNPDGVDMSQGVYGENGSLMYPGYGYAPYGPYSPAGSPVPTTSHDGQLYGTQHYQYPSPYFQPVTPPSAPPKGDFTRSAAGGQPSFTVDTTAKENTGAAPVRPVTNPNPVFGSNGSYGSGSQNGFQDPVYRFDGAHSPIPWLDSTMYYNGQPRSNTSSVALSNNNGFASKNQNVGSHSHLVSPRPMSAINTASGYMNRAYPNKLYGQYQGAYGSGFGYGSNSYGSQNRQGWLTLDNKYRSRGRGNGFFNYNNENSDGLNELNRGPRARITKNQKVPTRVTITIKGQNDNLPETVEKDTVCAVPDREQYNHADFPETYTDAKFFIIKSYSEDDVHKSVKYNVWSSTQNGNKKLDAAYHEAQQKPEKCPVFLFFSVNTSGQFVGVAEMVGPVDFNKSLDYWQQDKWVGYFPVKWHIIKDVPNSMLKHIILEYNENKPVTNSRDTQEVKLEQGLQMIKVFKDHSSKQCILDDFEFYEERQKRIQEKKAKQQLQKQAWEEKPTLVEKNKEEVSAPDLVKEEVKLTENVSFDKAI